MKKRIKLIVLAAAAYAITADAQQWTLEQCIDYALENNISIKTHDARVDNSRLEADGTRNGYLPTVNGFAQQGFDFGRGLTAQNTYANRNTANTSVGAQLSLPLFDGLATWRKTAVAKANLATALEETQATRDDVTLNIIAAYLQVLYYKEMQQVAAHQVSLSEFQLSNQKALVEVGKIPEIDLLQSESQLAQDKYALSDAENQTSLALVNLATLLSLTDMTDFDVAPLSEQESIIPTADEIYNLALSRNHSVKAAQASIDAAESNIALAQTGYLPKINFNAGIGSSYYRVSGMDNESFGRQFRNNYSTQLGFSLNIPIFDGLNTSNSIKRARVNKVLAQLQLDDVRQNLMSAIRQAYYAADGAYRKLQSSATAQKATATAFEAVTQKYAVGRATPTDYQDAKAKALQAEANTIQAKYELILRTRILNFYAHGIE